MLFRLIKFDKNSQIFWMLWFNFLEFIEWSKMYVSMKFIGILKQLTSVLLIKMLQYLNLPNSSQWRVKLIKIIAWFITNLIASIISCKKQLKDKSFSIIFQDNISYNKNEYIPLWFSKVFHAECLSISNFIICY